MVVTKMKVADSQRGSYVVAGSRLPFAVAFLVGPIPPDKLKGAMEVTLLACLSPLSALGNSDFLFLWGCGGPDLQEAWWESLWVGLSGDIDVGLRPPFCRFWL